MALKKRVIVVGLGSIGKRHFRLLKERDDIVVEAAESNEEVAANAKKEFGNIVCYNSFDEALHSKPDVVWLATPTALHMQQSIAALQMGCHVFCEKPMASSAAEARKIRDAVLQSGKVFNVGYYLRFWKGMTTLKKLIAAGVLGNILHAHARVGTYITLVNSVSGYQATKPGSLFLDYAHQPDLFYWLFEKKPLSVYVSSLQGGDLEYSSMPNVADIVMRYGDDVPFAATIHLNYVQMPQRHEYEVTGDKAWALLDAEAGTLKIGYRESSSIETISVAQDRDDIFRLEHQAFFDMIDNNKNAENAVEACVITQEICDAILQAWKSV